nr:sensor histidine kinase [Chitinophagaceae bacterium]
DNAIKYCPFHPSIHINIYETDHSIVFSIKDNGIGVAPEYRKKIFEKFFRVPYGNTHNAKGYGLGLSYVARVVEQHQGTIEVKSQPGNGTTFTIHFPKTEA